MHGLLFLISLMLFTALLGGCASVQTNEGGQLKTENHAEIKVAKKEPSNPREKTIVTPTNKGALADKNEQSTKNQKSPVEVEKEHESLIVNSKDINQSEVLVVPKSDLLKKEKEKSLKEANNINSKAQHDAEQDVEGLQNEARGISTSHKHKQQPERISTQLNGNNLPALDVPEPLAFDSVEGEVRKVENRALTPQNEQNNRHSQSVKRKVADETMPLGVHETLVDQTILLNKSDADDTSGKKQGKSSFKQIGLSEAFKQKRVLPGTSLDLGVEVGIMPETSKSKVKETLSIKQVGFNDSFSKPDLAELKSNLRVGFNRQGVNLDEGRNYQAKRVVVNPSGNRRKGKDNSSTRLVVGFKEMNEDDTRVFEQVGEGKSKLGGATDNITKPDEKKEKETAFMKVNSRSNYDNLRSFLGENTTAPMATSKTGQKRKYEKLRNWSPTLPDQNRTDLSRPQNSNQFNQALEWIRQKGRIDQ